VGEVFSSCEKVRYVYEPFNWQWNAKLQGELSHFEYLKKESEVPRLVSKAASRAFQGRQTVRQIQRAFYRRYLWPSIKPFDYVVVKDPTAVLMTDYIASRANTDVLILVRHPCAFVSSIMRLDWHLKAKRLLRQPVLMSDHLKPYRHLIGDARGDPLTTGAAIWCAIHIVLFNQAITHPTWVVRKYEELCVDGGAPILGMCADLGLQGGTLIDSSAGSVDRKSDDAGSTSRPTESMPNAWKAQLSEAQVKTIMSTVRDFGLGDLYETSTT
jgi:hypothetical protein